jgi:hypothetical protein
MSTVDACHVKSFVCIECLAAVSTDRAKVVVNEEERGHSSKTRNTTRRHVSHENRFINEKKTDHCIVSMESDKAPPTCARNNWSVIF